MRSAISRAFAGGERSGVWLELAVSGENSAEVDSRRVAWRCSAAAFLPLLLVHSMAFDLIIINGMVATAGDVGWAPSAPLELLLELKPPLSPPQIVRDRDQGWEDRGAVSFFFSRGGRWR